MLVVSVNRDPRTQRFHFQSAIRTDHGRLEEDVIRGGSPTRFAASFHCWLQKAAEHFSAEVGERWDDELESEIVDVVELAALGEQPTD
jgi:hypothetical protein